MGELEQKKIRKINQDTFNVRQELNEVKVWNNLPETGMGENLQKEKLSYLDNMIINSQDENIIPIGRPRNSNRRCLLPQRTRGGQRSKRIR